MVLPGECPPNHQKKDPKSAKGPLIGCLDTMLLTARRRSHSGPGVCSQAQDHIERLRRLGEIRPSVFSRSPRALGPAGPMMHSIPRWRHHLIKSDGAQRHQIITFRFAANCRGFVAQVNPSTRAVRAHRIFTLMQTCRCFTSDHQRSHPRRQGSAEDISIHSRQERRVNVSWSRRVSRPNFVSQPQPLDGRSEFSCPASNAAEVTVFRHEPLDTKANSEAREMRPRNSCVSTAQQLLDVQ